MNKTGKLESTTGVVALVIVQTRNQCGKFWGLMLFDSTVKVMYSVVWSVTTVLTGLESYHGRSL